ncbi:siderophore-interacting protein [Streptomyces albipurpureus]|uniref:Siderophore-interacting protein n=1 Tax=Streptomyces albipurpureus TaxID=2897419 RepID=A0ABT0UXL0_9ACTN|nr:siderophore-interacting protein [Streptomyces sp. CWNU-1]MCM2393210.1 siderophore-interacting protein [Streptomyces sp. CWNU-1]
MSDAPYQFFYADLVHREHLTPSMIRVTLGGDGVNRMATAGRDQRIKLFLPQPGQRAPVMPDTQESNWYDTWRALDPDVRGVMRSYTVRELRREPAELIIDFAIHGSLGPASRWVRTAEPGSRVGVLAPVEEENAGYDFRPPKDTDWILLTGDESALPAIAGILAALPPSQPTRVWLELRNTADRQELPTKADAEIVWLTGEGATADAIRGTELPHGTPYAWVAGESSTVRAVRRHLVGERGFDRRKVKFTGYWRKGASEDELLARDEDA